MTLNLKNTRVRTVIIGGVPTCVRVDEAGRLLAARTGYWVDPAGANERVAGAHIVAATAVVVADEALEAKAVAEAEGAAAARAHLLRLLTQVVAFKEKAQGHAKRTNSSTLTKQDRAAAQQARANEWLRLAHRKLTAKKPSRRVGPDPLCTEARKIAALNTQSDETINVNEITEHRARQFLVALRKSG